MARKKRRPKFPPLEESPEKNVFVMMRYRDTDQFTRIEQLIISSLHKSGLYARFANDLPKAQWLWNNITRYMDNCEYGIAVFDAFPLRRNEPRINPNVCTELGYMLAKDKPCLILRDSSLSLHADLQGMMFEEYDGQMLDSLTKKVATWVEQIVRIQPLFHGLANLLPESKIASRLNESTHEKMAIGKYLAEHYLPAVIHPRSIILDSGTSAAAVAEALFLNRKHYKRLDIYTNNLLASVLLCSANEFVCKVVPGEVDDDYAGVFGPSANQAIEEIKADTTILACTGFTADQGPFANSIENRSFKRAIIDKTENTVIVVPADRLGKKVGHPVVENRRTWKRILQNNVSLIITSPQLGTRLFRSERKKLGRRLKIVEP